MGLKLLLITSLFAAAMWIGAKAGHVLDRNIKPIHQDLVEQIAP
jgi:hypothetical protein